ncbi:HEAT repeat domain-containing protein [Paenibacillus eucommiae]|uniref:HEAT repeat protein n=1 Tax=Paenibacillus eucommiae TaxID=1355755 RepID=A0ABS4IUH0_9BACL|nr:hypothetical protein [Paenibacillus eucommiae]MBP1991237.1 HEAT repeat protein [Paenibacillus eucommiae]
MSILDKLAVSLNRKDEVPNQELAHSIAVNGDEAAVEELIDLLSHKNKNVQSDCIKVLYEIGALQPDLITDYGMTFVHLLGHPNNRLVWGAMTALAAITEENPQFIASQLETIMLAADKGSVIAKDQAVRILIQLCSIEKYAGQAFSLLIEQLKHCPTNQLPMYAEQALPVIHDGNKKSFIDTLSSRLDDIEKASKRSRVEKVIRKMQKI